MWWWLVSVALAQSPAYPVTVAAGLTGLTARGDGAGAAAGVQGAGRALVHWRRVALDLSGRAGLVSADLREVSVIGAGLRWAPNTVYGRIGVLHNHETPWALLKERPIASVLGTATGIRHRTGAELALGVHAPVARQWVKGERLGAFAELSAAAYLEPNGPPVYGNLDVGLTLALGKPRAAVASAGGGEVQPERKGSDEDDNREGAR